MLSGPQLGNIRRTHLGPTFKFYVGTIWAKHGLKYGLQVGLSAGSMLAPCGFQAGLDCVLSGPQLSNIRKTHLVPSFKFYVGTTSGKHGLKYGLQVGL